jgi:hypothetical protein
MLNKKQDYTETMTVVLRVLFIARTHQNYTYKSYWSLSKDPSDTYSIGTVTIENSGEINGINGINQCVTRSGNMW